MSLKDPLRSTYVSIREDDGLKSLSRNERAFTRECALPALTPGKSHRRSLRVDGRSLEQVRPVQLHLGRWDHGAECTVQWGNTRVTSLCTAELVRPNLDRPNEGQLVISVDLSPGASPAFRQAPPATTGGGIVASSNVPNFAGTSQRLAANRILRCLEKIILTGGTLDVEALCLIPSQWVWRFSLALTVLDDGGNCTDAAVMAAIASLRHYRKPQVDMVGDTEGNDNSTATPVLIPSHLKEPTPLPLHHTPLSISFAFFPMEDGSSHSTAASALSQASSSGVVAALVDPTDREELLQNGSLTVGMNIHAEVCLLDYGGGCELPPMQLEDCWKRAAKSVRKLCTMLETSLEEADEQAQTDRLAKLQEQQGKSTTSSDNPNLPPLPSGEGPFFQQSDNPGDNAEAVEASHEEARRLETEAEEAYKRNALDFTQGYQAQKVREDTDGMRHSSQAFFNQASNLFQSILQSSKAAASSGTAGAPQSTTTTENMASETTSAAKKEVPAKEEPKPKTKPKKAPIDSDDEEETTQMLQSEFDEPAPKAAESKPVPMDVDKDDDDDSIDDLAMAISKKKKKKKSKK